MAGFTPGGNHPFPSTSLPQYLSYDHSVSTPEEWRKLMVSFYNTLEVKVQQADNGAQTEFLCSKFLRLNQAGLGPVKSASQITSEVRTTPIWLHRILKLLLAGVPHLNRGHRDALSNSLNMLLSVFVLLAVL